MIELWISSTREKLFENNKWCSVPHGYLLLKHLFPLVKNLADKDFEDFLLTPGKLLHEDLPESEKMPQLIPLLNFVLPKSITKTMEFQQLWGTSNQHTPPAGILAKNTDWFTAYRRIYDECQVSISSFKQTSLGFGVNAPTMLHACVVEGLLLCTMNIRIKSNTCCTMHGVYKGNGCPQCKELKKVDKRFHGWIRKLVHEKSITTEEREKLKKKYAYLKELHEAEVAYQKVRESLVLSGKIRRYGNVGQTNGRQR